MSLTPGRKGDWISTYTGKKFYPFDPRPEDIFIEDIAHSLSLVNRYNGHSLHALSVAQHSVLVSNKCSKKNKLWGLAHDFAESYCQDINSLTKRAKAFAFYRKMEAKIQKAICKRFGLPIEEPDEVRKVDKRILYTEAKVLIKSYSEWNITAKPYKDVVIAKWTPERAEEELLTAFYALGGKYHV